MAKRPYTLAHYEEQSGKFQYSWGTWGDFRLKPGAVYDQKQVEGGQPGDFWIYEDRVIYGIERVSGGLYILELTV